MWSINYNRVKRQFKKNTVSTKARKIPAGKKPSREKTPQEIWEGAKAQALKSPSYEGYTAPPKGPTYVYLACIPTKRYKLKIMVFENNKQKIKKTSQNPRETQSVTY